MKCLGRTAKFKRCRNSINYLGFCHQHRFQPFVCLISFLTLIGLIGGIFQDIWKPIFSSTNSERVAEIQLVDILIEETDSFHILDIKLRNNSNEVVFIKKIAIKTINSWHLENQSKFNMVPASWEYDIKITDEKDKISKVSISQAVKPNDVDRFKLIIGGVGKSFYGLTPHLIELHLIYNEDNKVLQTPKILIDIPQEILVNSSFTPPMTQQLVLINQEKSREILSQIDSTTIVSKSLLDMLNFLINIDISKFE